MTTIDTTASVLLQPLLNELFNYIWAIVLGLAYFGFRWLRAKIIQWVLDRHLTTTENAGIISARLEEAFNNSMHYAYDLLKDKINTNVSIDVKNEFLAAATKYSVDTMTDSLKALKIDEKGVEDRLRARFAKSDFPVKLDDLINNLTKKAV